MRFSSVVLIDAGGRLKVTFGWGSRVADVFISYSRRDAEFVHRLQHELESRGKEVWVDVEGIRDAEVFPEILRRAIESSDAFVFVISPDAVRSQFCVEEVEHAVALNKRVVPLSLRAVPDAELPDAIRVRNWIPVGDGEFEQGVGRLIAAVETDLEWERQHSRLTVKALDWEHSGRDRSFLLRGSELAAAEQWLAAAAGRESGANAIEQEYLLAARLARSRRQRGLIGVSLVVAAVSVGLLVFALISRSHAITEARVALADSLGAQAIADPHLDRAMLLGVEAARLDPSERTQGDLLTALLRAPSAIRTLHGDGLRVNGIALSPDGRTVALEDNVPNIIFLDAATGARIGEVPTSVLRAPPSAIAYLTDGQLAFQGGGNPPSEVDLIDPARRGIAQRLVLPRTVRAAVQPPGPFGGSPNFGGNNFASGPRGLLAVAVAGYAVQWALPRGRLAARPFRLPGSASFLFYRSNGHQLVSVGDGEAGVLDARSGRVLRTYKIGGGAAALSPDGRTLVLGDNQGTVRFLNLESGAVTTAVAAHAGAVDAVGITPDGRSAVTSGDDGKSLVWDLATHQVRTSLVGHAGPVRDQAISPDGSTLYTGSFDTTILASDLSGKRGFVRSFVAARSNPALMAWNVAISPNGRVLAVGGDDGRVNLWDARSLQKLGSFQAVPGFVGAVSFGPRGRTLLVAGDQLGPHPHGVLRIWRLGARPTIAHDLTGGPPLYTWATFSPNGRFVAATGSTPAQLSSPYKGDGLVAEWNASGGLLSSPMHLAGGGGANDVGFADHGSRVVVSQLGDRVAVVDPARQAVVARWRAATTLLTAGAALSPDGQRVATVDFDGFLREWRATDGKGTLRPIRASESAAWSVNWSPDGSRLVTAGADNTVRIYDAQTGQQIGTSLPMPGEQQVNNPYAAYSQDGSTIAATDSTGRVWLYPAALGGWETYACRLAARNLTRAEWAKFVPGQPYSRICPGNSG